MKQLSRVGVDIVKRFSMFTVWVAMNVSVAKSALFFHSLCGVVMIFPYTGEIIDNCNKRLI